MIIGIVAGVGGMIAMLAFLALNLGFAGRPQAVFLLPIAAAGATIAIMMAERVSAEERATQEVEE